MRKAVFFAFVTSQVLGTSSDDPDFEEASYPTELFSSKEIKMGGFILYLIGKLIR